MRQLAAADRRAAVWCAAQCARTVLHLGPEAEERPRREVELAEAWARGEVSERVCRPIAEAANAEGGYHRHCESWEVWTVYATNTLIGAIVAGEALPRWVAGVADCAAEAAAAGAATEGERREIRAAHLAAMLALVSSIHWPPTLPAHERILRAPSAVQVALDRLSAPPRSGLPIPDLVEARARADRLALDWNDPVQRAVAERTADVAAVGELLSGGTPRSLPPTATDPASEG